MIKDEFCKACPDRGGEVCVLPSLSERFSTRSKLVGAQIGEGFLYIGWAASAPRTRYEEGTLVARLDQRVKNAQAMVKTCVELHQL